MLRTTSEKYSNFIANVCTQAELLPNRSKRPVWRDRDTNIAVAVRFMNRRGENVYFIRPEYEILQEVDYISTQLDFAKVATAWSI